jgi:hypothetical protein
MVLNMKFLFIKAVKTAHNRTCLRFAALRRFAYVIPLRFIPAINLHHILSALIFASQSPLLSRSFSKNA